MAKQESYYAAEVEEYLGRRALSARKYALPALIAAGVVGCGLGWLLYDRWSSQAEQKRIRHAREANRQNARRAMAMKQSQKSQPRPESFTAGQGMRNIPDPTR